MAVVPLTNGIDVRAILVDTTGTFIGSVANPLITQGPGAGGATMVQGLAATGAAVSGNPVYVGGKDASGNVQPIPISASADGTAIPSNGLYTFASLAIHDATPNTLSFARTAFDLVGGVTGHTFLGTGIAGYDSTAALFRPVSVDGSGRALIQTLDTGGNIVTLATESSIRDTRWLLEDILLEIRLLRQNQDNMFGMGVAGLTAGWQATFADGGAR